MTKRFFGNILSLIFFAFIGVIALTVFLTRPVLGQNDGIISTVAGGAGGYYGDGGPATSAKMNGPYAIAFDNLGNMYIADKHNDCIRMVDSSGIIHTIAGNGINGYSGDGGPATSAQLYEPAGITFDSNGNLFIADLGNNCIREVDTSGIIRTVAGNGTNGYSGDGGPATLAQLSYPSGVAFDSNGNMFIADSSNHRIRKVDVLGNITTVAGDGTMGSSGINKPVGLTFDINGNLYIAEQDNCHIRKLDTFGNLSTVAGKDGIGYSGDFEPAIDALLYWPCDVAFDNSGNMYISDSNNNRIRKVDNSGIINTVVGNGIAGYSGDGGVPTAAQINRPCNIVFDSSGNMYIADSKNNCIRKVVFPAIQDSQISPASETFDKYYESG